ncbi:MAG: N-acetylmuramoyl-L-alanine amidase [Armatimonadetes bacterium]|nr:N-acetylmuramoyl-L-alanine amidase [Armatimonadota bacterium]
MQKLTMKSLMVLGLSCLSGLATAQADYGFAIWNPAYSGNFTTSNREATYPINYVVIHIMEGSYAGSISWFQNPSSNVSAHYCLKSSTGEVTQMVREKDLAWHAGVTLFNQQAVGIEHEATTANPALLTTTMYWSSARLTRYLCTKYSIPRNRTYIIGHKETGRATSCPGPWDWNVYMPYVLIDATAGTNAWPGTLTPGQTYDVTVRMNNTGVDTWLGTGTDAVNLETSPAGRVSPFFTSGNWINNTKPAAVFASTVPATPGEFRFRLTAPSTPGNYTESFQLNRASVGRYGPIINLPITVGNSFERVIDNTDTAFSVTGTWSTSSAAADRVGTNYRYALQKNKTTNSAQWNLNVTSEGMYDLFAWWPTGSSNAPAVTYTVTDVMQGSVVRTFNQQINGGQWNLIGRARLAPGTDKVNMSLFGRDADFTKLAVADAVKVVGPY